MQLYSCYIIFWRLPACSLATLNCLNPLAHPCFILFVDCSLYRTAGYLFSFPSFLNKSIRLISMPPSLSFSPFSINYSSNDYLPAFYTLLILVVSLLISAIAFQRTAAKIVEIISSIIARPPPALYIILHVIFSLSLCALFSRPPLLASC
jgi:hypothetical protein